MKKLIAVILALVMVLALAACGASGSSGKAENTVTIGVFEPASGVNGAGGKQETLGVQYANSVQPTVEIGGKTYNVVVKYVDNESSNDKAPSAAAELVNAGCSIVLGSYGSGVSIAGGPTFEEAGIPAVGITCTNPQVTEGNRYYFRICFLDPFQGTVLANYAFSELGVKKAYCLNKLGDDYSGGLVNYFIEAFEGLGGECVHEEFPDGNSDFTSYVANAKAADCGVFFSPVSTEAAQLIIDQVVAQGASFPLLAGDTWDSNVILQAAKGKDVNITVTTFYPEGANADFDSNIKKWINDNSTNLANNGGDDTVAAVTAMGYDAYFFALAALQKAGSTEPAKVMDAVWSTTIDGVTGPIALEQTNGDAIRNTAFVKQADTASGTWIALDPVTIK